MAYINASTARIRRPWTLRGHLRGLGVGPAIVGGTLQLGPSLTTGVSRQMPYKGRPVVTPVTAPIVNPVNPIVGPISTTWGGNPPGWQGKGSSPIQTGGGYWASQQGGGQGQQGGWGGNGGWASDNPANSNNLAQLTLQYQSNPSSLTAQQWAQLQAAGVIPSTVPYSNASLVNPTSTSSGIDPATGVAYSTELAEAEAAAGTTAAASSGISTALSTLYGGIPLYIWLGGGVLLFIMLGKRR
jgi:hypothetical protein